MHRYIEGILNQSYRNLDIIISNHCSKDNSVKLNIYNEYAEKNQKIIIIYKEDAGLGSTRRDVFKIATRDYIILLMLMTLETQICISV